MKKENSKIQAFLEKNGIKLASNAKAGKLLSEGKSDAEVAKAMVTTKAYKEYPELRSICLAAIEETAKKQEETKTPEPKKTSSCRGGEPSRY